jgi:hypothetical protein
MAYPRVVDSHSGDGSPMILLLLAAVTAAAQPETDVLARSKSGMVMCSNPDTEAKRCSAISAYTVSQDGSVRETTEIVIVPNPPITLTMSVKAEISGGFICGTMMIDDLRQGQIRMNPLPAAQSAAVLQRLETAMGPVAGKRVCEDVRIEGGRLVKYGQAEGVDLKLPPKPVAWISLSDGYKVAPR